MKKIIVLTCSLIVILITGCGPSSEVLAVTMVAQTDVANILTNVAILTDMPAITSIPTDTPIPIDTPTPIETPTLSPTATATYIPVPQQWNGFVSYSEGWGTQSISLLIEEIYETIYGTEFSGKMIWHPFNNIKGATLRMEGEYVTDFGDAVEQQKWNYHPDYKSGDRSGTWLKWTETEVIDGRNYTVNGWYYAHIREDKTMVAIYYFSANETVPSSDHLTFKLVQP